MGEALTGIWKCYLDPYLALALGCEVPFEWAYFYRRRHCVWRQKPSAAEILAVLREVLEVGVRFIALKHEISRVIGAQRWESLSGEFRVRRLFLGDFLPLGADCRGSPVDCET